MITIKFIIKIIKRLIYALLLLYSLNLSLKNFGIVVPINEANILVTSILGIPGILGLFFIKVLLF